MCVLLFGSITIPSDSFAQAATKKDEPGLFDSSSPYLDYGEFDLSDDEDQETLYFQYGRFFGVSVGAGYQGATGNRGKLYTAAVPRVDIKVHYWFDFNLAMNLGVSIANHTFTDPSDQSINRVNLTGFMVDLKYYFDVKNKGAALTFSNPFLIGGVGAISKSQSSLAAEPETDSTLSLSGGLGLEFPVVLKKSYFIIEGRYHTQSFEDTTNQSYQTASGAGVPDLSGGFVSLMAHILFTW